MNMICSVCKKNPAVVFINKVEGDKTSVEGLCYNCAKEKGINPLQVLSQNANISNDDIDQISEQLGNFMDEISNTDGSDELDENGESSNPFAGIFNLFKGNSNNSEANVGGENSNKRKTVKVEKKSKNNKKKFLDTFGTNLTAQALERKN